MMNQVKITQEEAAKLIKLRSMLKRGVPLAAVEAQAVREGVNVKNLQTDEMSVVIDNEPQQGTNMTCFAS